MLPYTGVMAGQSAASLVSFSGGIPYPNKQGLGLSGAQPGDYAIYVTDGSDGAPGTGWGNIANASALQLYSKVLVAGDFTASKTHAGNWVCAVYRDVKAVAVVSEAGFTKSSGYVGVFAVAYLNTDSDAGFGPQMYQRFYQGSVPIWALADLVMPSTPYVDGSVIYSSSHASRCLELRSA